MSDNIVSSSYHHLPLLPEDVEVEILLRLPSKSLIRSKSVCKRWRNLINNSEFLMKHLLPACDNDHHLLLVKRRDTNKDHVFSFLPHPSPSRPLPFPEIPVISDEDFEYQESEIQMLGPCNGLVCLFDSNVDMGHHILLWRPADGETKTLPPSDVPHPGDAQPEAYIRNPQIGFAYDAETEDYKVIRMGLLQNYDHVVGSKIEIYSFKHDIWKGVAHDGLPLSFSYFSTVCLNDMIFWWAEDGRIIWFRMDLEWFGTITVPFGIQNIALRFDSLGELLNIDEYTYDNNPYWEYNLFVLNDENLALVVYDSRSRTRKCFHVWVLFEIGVKESWTRVFTVGPLARMQRPVWFWRNCKIVMENTEGGLVSYDLLTKDMESLGICGVPQTFCIISIEDKYISY